MPYESRAPESQPPSSIKLATFFAPFELVRVGWDIASSKKEMRLCPTRWERMATRRDRLEKEGEPQLANIIR